MNSKLSIVNYQLSIILLGVVCFLCCGQAQAQTTFGYDLSGNRISRVIKLTSPLRSAEESEENQTEEETTEVTGDTIEEPVEQEIHSEMLNDFSVLIYPNPTKGELTVKIQGLQKEKTANLRLYSASGSLIQQKTGVSDMEHLDISNQPAGIYILKVISDDSSTDWKIIKQ